MQNIINPPAIEQEAVTEHSIKANKLLASIVELKRKRKTAKEALEDELLRNKEYAAAMDEYEQAKESLKQSKAAAMLQSGQAEKIKAEITELKIEIKNDSEILNDFVATAYKAGEQMRLFADGEDYSVAPKFSIKKKSNSEFKPWKKK